MAQYLRVVRRGKHNVRVELPDHTTQLVSVTELPLWELVVALANNTTAPVPNNTEVINLDNPLENNVSESAPSEEPKAEESPKEDKSKKEKKAKKESKPKSTKADYKAGNFRKNTNGLGVDHPYETVNTNVESVEYEEGVVSPF